MSDPLENYMVYNKSIELFDKILNDTNELMKDPRGQEIAKQLVRSAGSICANFEEGYGRESRKEYLHFLRISRGSARETKGWIIRSKQFLTEEIIEERIDDVDCVISMLVSFIKTLEGNINDP